MDYKGYKLLDKILLVCRDIPEHEESFGYNSRTTCYQAYLVDPASSKQLDSARHWAKWTEYGPAYKDSEGKWTRDYEIEHSPIEFEFENNGFTLELLDCAGGSSQGGKLSFWNCLVSKDDKIFKIGINSDMLLDLLKNATFDKGKCQSPLIFITQNGKVGMTAEGSDTYKQCVSDRELKKALKASQVSKFEFGDILKTTTINEVYLGTVYQYYSFDPGNNPNRYTKYYDFRDCIITKLAKPIKYHVFDTITDQTKLSDFTNKYGHSSWYSFPDFKKSCPKRTVDSKIELDITQEDFYKQLGTKIYDLDSWVEYYMKHYLCATEDHALYYFLVSRCFGYNIEPFELSEDLLRRLKTAGMKYVEE
jgi:hypothetical protein